MAEPVDGIDMAPLEALIKIRQEQAQLQEYRTRAEQLQERFDPAVYQRVLDDYARRHATLDEQALPLKAQGRQEYQTLREKHRAVHTTHEDARLAKEELEFRHAVGELDEALLAERLQEPDRTLAQCREELAALDACKARFLEAFGSEEELEQPPQPTAPEPSTEPVSEPVAAAAMPGSATAGAATAEGTEAPAAGAGAAGARAAADGDSDSAAAGIAASGSGPGSDSGEASEPERRSEPSESGEPGQEPGREVVAAGGPLVAAGSPQGAQAEGETPQGAESAEPGANLAAESPLESIESSSRESGRFAETLVDAGARPDPDAGSGPEAHWPPPGPDSTLPASAALQEDRTNIYAAVPPGEAGPDAGPDAGDAPSHTVVVPVAVLVGPQRTNDETAHRLGVTTSLGRAEDNHIRVRMPGVSRQHAVIALSPGGFRVEDLRSQNGTFVNGERVIAQVLQEGDRIALGDAEFVFHMHATGAPTPPPVFPGEPRAAHAGAGRQDKTLGR